MLKSSYLFVALLIAMALLSMAYAQSPSPIDQSLSVNVIIYRDLVRFAAEDAHLLRVELFDLTGNRIFDSGFTEGNSVDWFAGQSFAISQFAYALSIKDKNGLVTIAKRGNVSIDRERNNLIDAPALEVIPGNRNKKGRLHTQTDSVFDVNASEGSYDINAARMRVGTANVGTKNLDKVFINPSGEVGIDIHTPTSTLTVPRALESTVDTVSASIINANTQYNFAGQRVLSAPGIDNIFVGIGAGSSNVIGSRNSFFGYNAGFFNTNGGHNSFFGYAAGLNNVTGVSNSFFGSGAGQFSTSGSANAFFGDAAGEFNTSGSANAFFGSSAGLNNTIGVNNSFFGSSAGIKNNTGGNNAFFGYNAGFANTTGGANAFFGNSAGPANTTGTNNSFFGQAAGPENTTGSNNAFFGNNAGFTNTTGSNNSFVGTFAGQTNTTGSNNSILGAQVDMKNGLTNATAIGFQAFVGQSNSLVLGSIKGVNSAAADTNVGIGTTTPAYKLDVAGAAHASSFPTSSDVRLKMNVAQLMNVLDKIEKIRGVAFDWNDLYKSLGRSTGHREIGVVAQEVEAVFPELVTHWGEEGYRAVDYGRLTGVLVEAVKELRAEKDSQIAALEKQNAALRLQSAAMDARLTAIEKKMRSSGSHRSTNTRRRKISVKRAA